MWNDKWHRMCCLSKGQFKPVGTMAAQRVLYLKGSSSHEAVPWEGKRQNFWVFQISERHWRCGYLYKNRPFLSAGNLLKMFTISVWATATYRQVVLLLSVIEVWLGKTEWEEKREGLFLPNTEDGRYLYEIDVEYLPSAMTTKQKLFSLSFARRTSNCSIKQKLAAIFLSPETPLSIITLFHLPGTIQAFILLPCETPYV